MALKKTIINPYDDAVVHNSMKGDQFEGVWKGGAYSGLDYVIDEPTRTFNIQPGYGSIYGRQFELTETHEVSLVSLTGLKYCVVYVEVNLKNVTRQAVSIKLAYAGAGYPDVQSEDLIKNKNGIARMPLYQFTFNALAGGGEIFTDIEPLFYTYEPGTAEHVRIMEGTAQINERILQNILHFNADRWKNAEHAVRTSLGRKLGQSDEGAVQINEELKIIGSEYIDQHLVQVSSGVFRVTGQEHTTEPSDATILNQNTTYTFFYQGAGKQLPKNAKVIGIIVTGSIMYSKWDLGFLGIGSGWVDWRARQAMGNHDQVEPHYADYQADDKLTIFGGDIYRENCPLYLDYFLKYEDQIIGGVKTIALGTKLGREVVAEALAQFTFKNTNGPSPQLEVKVGNNVKLQIDLTFRLIYTGGEISWGQSDLDIFPTNPGVWH